jgi:very-short-patch-repair endonuclease
LKGADLRGADLCDANLNKANLIEANLAGADLTNAELNETKLNGTLLNYQKVSEELQQKNQELIAQVKLLKAQLEKQNQLQNLIEASNQGVKARHTWNSFYFRSKTEIKIAEALDRADVLFYPNSKARFNTPEGRGGKETDFLVFFQGKWGILEVDGEPWHPPSRVVHDHERDRLFKVHGIRIVEHYDANRCWNQPDKVVQEFLEILSQA